MRQLMSRPDDVLVCCVRNADKTRMCLLPMGTPVHTLVIREARKDTPDTMRALE